MSANAFVRLLRELHAQHTRFVLIGVAGANYYAPTASALFLTKDRDLFVPPDADNLLAIWTACTRVGLELYSGDEPLDQPRDDSLARRIVDQRSLTRATDGAGLEVDLTLEMAGFEFERVWTDRRSFQIDELAVPVARLAQIVASKRAAGRNKDALFLESYAQALDDLLQRERDTDSPPESTDRRPPSG